eukprot:tig00020607_g11920.t1
MRRSTTPGLPGPRSDNVRVDEFEELEPDFDSCSAYDVLHRSRDAVPERYKAEEVKSPAAAWNRWHADRARGPRMPAQQRQQQTIRVTVSSSPPMAAPPPLGSAVMVRVVRVAEHAAAARVAEHAAAARSGLRPSYASVPAFPRRPPAFLARVAERFGVGSDPVIYAAPGDRCPAPPASPAPASAPRARPAAAPSGPGSGSGSSGSSALSGSASAARARAPPRLLRIEPRGGHPPQPGDVGPAAVGAGAAAEPRRAPRAHRAPRPPLAAGRLRAGALPPSSARLTYALPSSHVLPPPLLLPAAPEAAAGDALALASPAASALSAGSYPATPGSALSRRTVHEEAAFLHRLYGGGPATPGGGGAWAASLDGSAYGSLPSLRGLKSRRRASEMASSDVYWNESSNMRSRLRPYVWFRIACVLQAAAGVYYFYWRFSATVPGRGLATTTSSNLAVWTLFMAFDLWTFLTCNLFLLNLWKRNERDTRPLDD